MMLMASATGNMETSSALTGLRALWGTSSVGGELFLYVYFLFILQVPFMSVV
jgi:hypothetical protein